MSTTQRTVLRRGSDRVVAGVCSGLAEYFDIDVTLVRLVFVVLLFTGVGILAYLVLWLVMPPPGVPVGAPREAVRANLRSLGTEMRQLGDDLRASFSQSTGSSGSTPTPSAPESTEPPSPPEGGPWRPRRQRNALWGGGILILLGVYFLLGNFGLLNWFNWSVFWPLVLILLGVLILARRVR